MIALLLLVCACDISLVQILPWNNTEFYKMSQGFPSKSLMRFSLGVDLVQASVSTICSVAFLNFLKDGKETENRETLLFTGVSITASLITVITSFMVLFLKEKLLELKKGAGGKEIARNPARRASAEIELENVYDKDEKEANTIYDENPLHFSQQVITTDVNSGELLSLQSMNHDLESEIKDTRERNDQLAHENETLQRRCDMQYQEMQALRMEVRRLEERTQLGGGNHV